MSAGRPPNSARPRLRERLAADYAFFVEGRRRGTSLPDLIHGYVYGRWTYLYISLGLGEHPLYRRLLRPLLRRLRHASPTASPPDARPAPAARRLPVAPPGVDAASHTVADGYHGKVVSTETARRLVRVEQPIDLPDLEQVIPFPRARALVLDHPAALAVIDCPCRASRPNPCLPLDVCLVVGDPFVSLVVAHRPDRARRISAAEAERILEETEARGNVHHAFFKDALYGRFYAICNCCACCCGAMQAHRRGTPMLASSGYAARVDPELCLACGECEPSCSFGALRFTTPAETAGRLYGMTVDEELCMGCGVCLSQCPQGAIALELAPQRGLPLDLALDKTQPRIN